MWIRIPSDPRGGCRIGSRRKNIRKYNFFKVPKTQHLKTLITYTYFIHSNTVRTIKQNLCSYFLLYDICFTFRQRFTIR